MEAEVDDQVRRQVEVGVEGSGCNASSHPSTSSRVSSSLGSFIPTYEESKTTTSHISGWNVTHTDVLKMARFVHDGDVWDTICTEWVYRRNETKDEGGSRHSISSTSTSTNSSITLRGIWKHICSSTGQAEFHTAPPPGRTQQRH